MTVLFVRHRVHSYSEWKGVYDEIASVRRQKGVTAARVLRDPSDPNLIIVTHQFKDAGAAREFANSEELKSAMARAGVNGSPEIWFGEEIEQTSF
jgi:quinol monooxygenase YgiN